MYSLQDARRRARRNRKLGLHDPDPEIDLDHASVDSAAEEEDAAERPGTPISATFGSRPGSPTGGGVELFMSPIEKRLAEEEAARLAAAEAEEAEADSDQDAGLGDTAGTAAAMWMVDNDRRIRAERRQARRKRLGQGDVGLEAGIHGETAQERAAQVAEMKSIQAQHDDNQAHGWIKSTTSLISACTTSGIEAGGKRYFVNTVNKTAAGVPPPTPNSAGIGSLGQLLHRLTRNEVLMIMDVIKTAPHNCMCDYLASASLPDDASGRARPLDELEAEGAGGARAVAAAAGVFEVDRFGTPLNKPGSPSKRGRNKKGKGGGSGGGTRGGRKSPERAAKQAMRRVLALDSTKYFRINKASQSLEQVRANDGLWAAVPMARRARRPPDLG